MSTIKDIAREAGVSIATVSIVLNGKGQERKISKETQERIYTIASQLNYVPNQSAKKLRATQRNSYAIAFFWATDFRINYLARITLGIQKAIMAQGKSIHQGHGIPEFHPPVGSRRPLQPRGTPLQQRHHG